MPVSMLDAESEDGRRQPRSCADMVDSIVTALPAVFAVIIPTFGFLVHVISLSGKWTRG